MRADHAQPNMGLTSWSRDEIRSSDVTVAKNYLKEEEIDELNRIVSMWLDYAEDQAKRRKQIFRNHSPYPKPKTLLLATISRKASNSFIFCFRAVSMMERIVA
jgi:hypothetical protein